MCSKGCARPAGKGEIAINQFVPILFEMSTVIPRRFSTETGTRPDPDLMYQVMHPVDQTSGCTDEG